MLTKQSLPSAGAYGRNFPSLIFLPTASNPPTQTTCRCDLLPLATQVPVEFCLHSHCTRSKCSLFWPTKCNVRLTGGDAGHLVKGCHNRWIVWVPSHKHRDRKDCGRLDWRLHQLPRSDDLRLLWDIGVGMHSDCPAKLLLPNSDGLHVALIGGYTSCQSESTYNSQHLVFSSFVCLPWRLGFCNVMILELARLNTTDNGGHPYP